MTKVNFFLFTTILICCFISLAQTKSFLELIKNGKCDTKSSYCNLDNNKNKIKLPPLSDLCDVCYLLAPIATDIVRKNDTTILLKVLKVVCSYLRYVDEEVCNQAVDLYKNQVIDILFETKLTDMELCSAGLGCFPIENPVYNWNVTLPDIPKPPVVPPTPPKSGSPVLRILQLTDIHIDFEYQPGAIADCDQPLCCRNSSTKTKADPLPVAGYWGDYRKCDIPRWTVEHLFNYISKNEKFDFIYWTGDLPPHNVWNQSKSDQVYALQSLTKMFLKYFPNKVIYPSLGNHEATPCNMFPTPNVKQDNISWLYQELARDWTLTGLPSYLTANITNGAFYTLQLMPGLRLVSLNTNYCPVLNFWLLINSTDPLGQFAWLINVLTESERINEKVHIIGHIYPSNCLQSWSENYYRIVNRFESTIAAQFFGHLHQDTFEIIYDLNDYTRAVSVAYKSSSVTTFSGLNPSYRIYTIDGQYVNSSYQVLDYETKFMNLTDANFVSMTPKWQKEYSAKEAYNLTGLYPQDWSNLVDNLLANLDSPYVDKMLKYYSISSDLIDNPCNAECRKNFLCGLKQARPGNLIPC